MKNHALSIFNFRPMNYFFLFCCSVFLSLSMNAQVVRKENLSKKDVVYWDFKKTKVQSTGAYYKDELGETKERHGKWEFYNEFGDLEEVRNFYRGKLHGQVKLTYASGTPRQEGYFIQNAQDSIYREWYENGKLTVEGYYKKNKPFAIWKRFYLNGKEESVEEYIDTVNYVKSFWLNDSLHTQKIVNGSGTKLTYYPNGKLKEKYNYEEGLRHGSFEEWSIGGYLLLTGNFKNERKDGEWKYYYYTGDLEKISHYKNGVLEGAYSYYYDNKVLNVSGNYHLGKKEGKWSWFTNKGTKDMEGNFVENLQDGDWTYYYPTGEVSYTAQFKADKKHGKWEYFYKNKQQFKVGIFADNEKEGEWKTWYENGTLLMEGKYEKGKEQGVWKNYWENGLLKNQSTFTNGELNGKWLSYNTQGGIMLEGAYKKGLKVGKWVRFMEKNSKQIEEIKTYKVITIKSTANSGFSKNRKITESVLHGKFVAYDQKDFQKSEEGTYKLGEKEGKWTAFYPGGILPAVVSSYKLGKLDGVLIEYGRKGEKMSETTFKNGVKDGPLKIYNREGKVKLTKMFSNGQEVQ